MTYLPSIPRVLFHQDWQERTIRVVDEDGHRSLYFDNHMIQSRMLLDNPNKLHLPYTRHMLASLLFNNDPRQIFMIGLGGGSLAKFFLHYFPKCHMEVVDSNPEMATIAQRFFFLPIDNRLKIHPVDGETFLQNRQNNKQNIKTDYDLILVDAYNHEGMCQSVYAKDFLMKNYALLSHSGIMTINANRAETAFHKTILNAVTECFPNQAFRLPVLHSNNEIIFCCHKKNVWGKKRQPLSPISARIDDPDLDFSDFLQRTTPLKQPFWRNLFRRLRWDSPARS